MADISNFAAEIDFFKSSHGSAKFSVEKTIVIAEISRVMDINMVKKRFQNDRCAVVIKNEKNQIGTRETAISTVVKSCINGAIIWEKIPRCFILCSIKIEHDDGFASLCIFNAVSLALLDMGIPMHFTFFSICISHSIEENTDLTVCRSINNTTVVVKNNSSILYLDSTNLTKKQLINITTLVDKIYKDLFEYCRKICFDNSLTVLVA
ncbi:hypothetical protein HZS_1061 [Henneguya salminicola]|nr:hypothetical protein HZS_1061 [Henneguya salminicola]